ncbi:MAG: hypothetical protein KGL53_16570, partial [Elusimicrobia bacterium]|nr:hypothetical protein [Elusimicrobiota bacterium]
MRKFLAVLLSVGIIWGPASQSAFAQLAVRAQAPAVTAVPGAIGAAGLSTTLLHQVDLSQLAPRAAAPSLAATPIEMQEAHGAAARAALAQASAEYSETPAAASAAAAVDRHPALAMISAVQQAGGESLLTQLDAARTPAQFQAVAAALPQGAVRASIETFARSMSAAQAMGSGIKLGSSDKLGQLFDNSRKADVMPAADAPKASGFWNSVARWRMPRPLAAFRRYALKKAEAARPRAQGIDISKLEVPAESLRWTPDPSKLPEKASDVERGAR